MVEHSKTAEDVGGRDHSEDTVGRRSDERFARGHTYCGLELRLCDVRRRGCAIGVWVEELGCSAWTRGVMSYFAGRPSGRARKGVPVTLEAIAGDWILATAAGVCWVVR